MTNPYVHYRPEVETIPADENQTINDILASMHRLNDRTKELYGHNVRVSHAKSHYSGLFAGK